MADSDHSSPAPNPKPDAWEARIAFLKKAAIWALFLATCYILRHFFAIIFLTFILSFAGSTVIGHVCRRTVWPRRLVTVLVGLVFVGIVSVLLYFVGSSFYRQAERFVMGLPKLSTQVEQWYADLPPNYREGILFLVGEEPPLEQPETPAATQPTQTSPTGASPERAEPPPEAGGTQAAVDDEAQIEQFRAWLKDLREVYAGEGFALAARVGWAMVGLVVALVLSIVFALLILFDLPQVQEDTRRLRFSRVGFIYTETAETVVAFAAVVGRMFQAQAVIACVNTVLTLLGLWILGVPNLAFLTVVVFLCSFIPIAGVFISSTPIVLVALTAPSGGVGLAIQCVIMIAVVHAIEAYILNPRIMGAHLHLNPVFVLLILFMGGHLVGVWGVLLGVPVAAYVYQTVHDNMASKSDKAIGK